jgi:WD40 repeat protein
LSSTPARLLHSKRLAVKTGVSYETRFDPSSRLAVSIGSNLSLWDIKSSSSLLRTRPFGHPSHANWSPDGNQLCLKGTSGQLVVLDAKTLAIVAQLQPNSAGEGCEATFSPDGCRVLDGTWGGLLAVYDVKTSSRLQEFRFPECMLTSMVSSPSRVRTALVVKPTLAAQRGSGRQDEIWIVKWSATGVTLTMVERKWELLDTVAFDSSEQILAVVHGDRSTSKAWLEIVDAASGETLRARECIRSHNGAAISWSPDGSVIGVVQPDGFQFYAADDLRKMASVPAKYACHLEFSRDGTWVALSAWSGGRIRLTADVL